MGREIKRVALDFDWPLEKVWNGYLAPEPPDFMADDEQDAWYESFVPVEPPEGPGYQLWETTSEGSPVSPVFAEPVDLARWMTQNGCMFANTKMSSVQAALKFIDAGWSPSMVMTADHGLEGGAEWIARTQ